MLAGLLTQTATVTPRTQSSTQDEYGDPLLVEGTPVHYPCFLQQRGFTGLRGAASVEETDAQDRTITRLVLYLPGWAVITHLDKVTVGAQSYEVTGEPATEYSLSGPDHIVVDLVMVQGG